MNEFNVTAFAVRWYDILKYLKGNSIPYFNDNGRLYIIDVFPTDSFGFLEGVVYTYRVSEEGDVCKTLFIIEKLQFVLSKEEQFPDGA